MDELNYNENEMITAFVRYKTVLATTKFKVLYLSKKNTK